MYSICPGNRFADATIWIAIACVTAAFDFKRLRDASGEEVPFPCSITPRSVAVGVLASVASPSADQVPWDCWATRALCYTGEYAKQFRLLQARESDVDLDSKSAVYAFVIRWLTTAPPLCFVRSMAFSIASLSPCYIVSINHQLSSPECSLPSRRGSDNCDTCRC